MDLAATDRQPGDVLQRLHRWLFRPLDIAALAAYRILFGSLMCVGSLRFMWQGWIERLYVEPTFHFKYWGFEWVQVPGPTGLYLLYAGIALSALLVALGCFYRIAIVAFWCLFTYAELMDVTTYLNHYYFVSLQALILCFLSPHRIWSIDAWRRPALAAETLPAWQTYWVRFQVGLLYLYAGLAKVETDWLFHAQPLNLWLPQHSGMPIIGPLLGQPWVHFTFSWFAFLFDTFIIAFMLWRRTRPYAFCVILVFHFFTHIFFNIGLFPFIMVFGVLIFFEPDWPRRVFGWLPIASLKRGVAGWIGAGRTGSSGPAVSSDRSVVSPDRPAIRSDGWTPTQAVCTMWIAGFCALQFLMPLRHWAYPGTVLWHEQGMRFSWRVMLREKSGALDYRVVDARGSTVLVSPHRYLTMQQYREMAAQPDMILQLAHRIRDDFNARGVGPVKVYADSVVSLNARPAIRMIDPNVDLAVVSDGPARAHWILPPPSDPPPLLTRLKLPPRAARTEAPPPAGSPRPAVSPLPSGSPQP
ncbi:MAG: HTTM domain-containing protein [Lautropia sp.]